MASQDDIPTPRQTGSWAVSIGRAKALIVRLERARETYRERERVYRSSNVLKRDPEKADEYAKYAQICQDNVYVLEMMIEKFEKWPQMPQIEVEKERPPLLAYLADLTTGTDVLCARLGKSY